MKISAAKAALFFIVFINEYNAKGVNYVSDLGMCGPWRRGAARKYERGNGAAIACVQDRSLCFYFQ